tara:strand:+ start:247 stop:651 length:405 start_codon:yes stop_codon:yes gene_type:complete
MESRNIKYKFKKLSPMNMKKLNKNMDNYFIKLDNNWFNLIDLYESVNTSKLNPITKKIFTQHDIKKIIKLYKELIEIEPKFNENTDSEVHNEKLLTDYIELFETQINDLFSKQEEIYALTQTHQHEIEKLNKVN